MENFEEIHEKNIDCAEGPSNERKWFEKRIEELKSEVEEMKWKRVEDMKANERVLAIFATKEEAWKKEKKQLMQELDALREIENCNSTREIENCNSTREIENSNNGNCSLENSGVEKQTDYRNHSIDELMYKLGKEIEQRKMTYNKFVRVVSEIKGQKNKVENMLRAAVSEMDACKRDAAMKAKEKRHVDAALRKVTEEILRLQMEVDDKDSIIDQMSQKKEAAMGVRDFLEAELRAKELELSNAKIMLKEYADGEWNREREVDKWKKLYLGIKLELDNLHMGSRQSSGLLENGHGSGGEGRGNRSGSGSRSRRVEAADLEKKHLIKIRCLENEIEAKNEQVEGLRRQVTIMENEMHRKDKEIELVSQRLSKAGEDKIEVERDAIFMKQMFSSYPLLLQKSKSCNSNDRMVKDTRQKGSKNREGKLER
ncbi:hypothetical protein KI387_035305 [Taxus chinensis]|uniref:Uncharacterized protein n=1 Tax=Taxus chinensis TaxID=29808 RepID=A0AA38FP54_TAXCH|nr:hypothetical protein KI387_035305 [Taxus chinensis]